MREVLHFEVYTVDDVDRENRVRVQSVVDGVPYHGRGKDVREALNHFVDVVSEHGAPAPGGVWGARQ